MKFQPFVSSDDESVYLRFSESGFAFYVIVFLLIIIYAVKPPLFPSRQLQSSQIFQTHNLQHPSLHANKQKSA
jgi:hypothetical protein